MNCQVSCGESIILSGRKASIIGGEVGAIRSIEADILGSDGEVSTSVKIGNDLAVRRRIGILQNKILILQLLKLRRISCQQSGIPDLHTQKIGTSGIVLLVLKDLQSLFNLGIEAGKDIVLRSGVMGASRAVIESKGNISAKFFEYTNRRRRLSRIPAESQFCRHSCQSYRPSEKYMSNRLLNVQTLFP